MRSLSKPHWLRSRIYLKLAVSHLPRLGSQYHSHSVIDGLANLEVMLHIVGPFGDELPVTCQITCREAWSVFDAFITKYGSDYESTEHVTRVLRHGLTFFGSSAL